MQNRVKRLAELQKLLIVCPTDVRTRCDLALLLEDLDLPRSVTELEEVLAHDPNHLQAREGVNRCRESGPDWRPFQSRCNLKH